MLRFVLGVDAALELAKSATVITTKYTLLAPTLFRSQVLAHTYAAVQAGTIDLRTANRQLDYLRSLRMRLLGDRVLQRAAWEIAAELKWPDTYQAEYLALTRLQADAFVTMDPALAERARSVVTIVSVNALTGGSVSDLDAGRSRSDD